MSLFNSEIVLFESTLQKLLQDAYCKGYVKGGDTNFDIDWQKEGWAEAERLIHQFRQEKENRKISPLPV